MKRAWLGFALLALVALIGCEPSGSEVGGTPAPDVKKIVSLSPSTTEVIGDLLLDDKLVGKTSSCDYPPGLRAAMIVVKGTKPDYELITRLQPDLVVYDAHLFSKSDIEKLSILKKAKIMPMEVDTVQGLQDYILEVGAYTGSATMASKVADDIFATVENARVTATGAKVRVAIVTGSGGGMYVAGTESFLADVVKVSGGQIVGPSGKIFSPMSVEALVKADPEIILTSEKASTILNDPRLATLNAVKARPTPRVYEVAPSILLRSTPRVKGIISNLTSLISKARRVAGTVQ